MQSRIKTDIAEIKLVKVVKDQSKFNLKTNQVRPMENKISGDHDLQAR